MVHRSFHLQMQVQRQWQWFCFTGVILTIMTFFYALLNLKSRRWLSFSDNPFPVSGCSILQTLQSREFSHLRCETLKLKIVLCLEGRKPLMTHSFSCTLSSYVLYFTHSLRISTSTSCNQAEGKWVWNSNQALHFIILAKHIDSGSGNSKNWMGVCKSKTS